MGDDNGLFILVQTDRNWFPTNQQAGKYYIKVQAANKGLVQEFTF